MIAAGALIVIETVTSSSGIPPNSVSMSETVSTATPSRPDLAQRARMVGVMAHQRRHVERGREAGLAVLEQVVEALVGLRGGAEARELAHRPQPAAVHRRVDPARERILAGQPDRIVVSADPVGQIGRGVQRPDRLPGQRGERGVALGGQAVGRLPLLVGDGRDDRSCSSGFQATGVAGASGPGAARAYRVIPWTSS